MQQQLQAHSIQGGVQYQCGTCGFTQFLHTFTLPLHHAAVRIVAGELHARALQDLTFVVLDVGVERLDCAPLKHGCVRRIGACLL